MKGRAERQLKGLEAAQKKEKSESKNNWALQCHHHPPVWDVERLAVRRKLSPMVAWGLFRLGRRWHLPVWPLLNLTHAHSFTTVCTLVRPGVQKCAFCKCFFKAPLQRVHTFPVNSCIWPFFNC
jgi:hypothetical protein